MLEGVGSSRSANRALEHSFDRDATERKLAAILSADVVGYSRMMSQDEVATIQTLSGRTRSAGTRTLGRCSSAHEPVPPA